MDRKQRIRGLLDEMADELLGYIKEKQGRCEGGWVPAAEIKNDLGLNLVAAPVRNELRGQRGWLFAILAHLLEEKGLIQYRKTGSRAFCRTTIPSSPVER